ncbi:hypothetical protein B484DRAFT_396642 [Ochromonadaceae sp. CCMP2298]|nr:hypothetical protein B484DRAFT_396642 [Ochromonadaceae sp. CCMP2298]
MMAAVRFAEGSAMKIPPIAEDEELQTPSPAYSELGFAGDEASTASDMQYLGRKGLAGVTPHVKKMEIQRNAELFRQTLQSGDFPPMAQSFESSTDANKLQSYLGYGDSPASESQGEEDMIPGLMMSPASALGFEGALPLSTEASPIDTPCPDLLYRPSESRNSAGPCATVLGVPVSVVGNEDRHQSPSALRPRLGSRSSSGQSAAKTSLGADMAADENANPNAVVLQGATKQTLAKSPTKSPMKSPINSPLKKARSPLGTRKSTGPKLVKSAWTSPAPPTTMPLPRSLNASFGMEPYARAALRLQSPPTVGVGASFRSATVEAETESHQHQHQAHAQSYHRQFPEDVAVVVGGALSLGGLGGLGEVGELGRPGTPVQNEGVSLRRGPRAHHTLLRASPARSYQRDGAITVLQEDLQRIQHIHHVAYAQASSASSSHTYGYADEAASQDATCDSSVAFGAVFGVDAHAVRRYGRTSVCPVGNAASRVERKKVVGVSKVQRSKIMDRRPPQVPSPATATATTPATASAEKWASAKTQSTGASKRTDQQQFQQNTQNHDQQLRQQLPYSQYSSERTQTQPRAASPASSVTSVTSVLTEQIPENSASVSVQCDADSFLFSETAVSLINAAVGQGRHYYGGHQGHQHTYANHNTSRPSGPSRRQSVGSRTNASAFTSTPSYAYGSMSAHTSHTSAHTSAALAGSLHEYGNEGEVQSELSGEDSAEYVHGYGQGGQYDSPPATSHSPTFMSYRKLQHESDSEGEEMGLDDLLLELNVSKPSFNYGVRRTFVSAPTWDHSLPASASPLPSSLKKGHAGVGRGMGQVGRVYGGLGSAKRVTHSNQVERQMYRPGMFAAAVQQSQSLSQHSWQHSSESSFMGAGSRTVGGYDADVSRLASTSAAQDTHNTLISDAAVAGTHTYVEDDSRLFELSVSDADLTAATGVDTTLTLDHKHPLDGSLVQKRNSGLSANARLNDAGGPRLAVMQLRRDKGQGEDIKEVNFSAKPGEATTVMLTISNHRRKPMCLSSHAVTLRFEPAEGKETAWDSDSLSAVTAPPCCSFEVSPRELSIPPGEDGTLFVTFTPAEAEGVYSGALKMRSRTKSFVMLLRGKTHSKKAPALAPVPAHTLTHAPAHAPAVVEAPVPIVEAAQVRVEQEPVDSVHSPTSPLVATSALDSSLYRRILRLNSAASKSSRISRPSRVASARTQVTSPASRSPASPATTARSTARSQATHATRASVTHASRSTPTTDASKDTPLSHSSRSNHSSMPSLTSVLSVGPESLQLRKAQGGRYEARLQLAQGSAESTEVRLRASAPFLKLSRSKVVLAKDSKESVKIFLDESDACFLRMCTALLAQDPTQTSAPAGYVEVHCAGECEYTVDVSIPRSACCVVQTQVQIQAQARAQTEAHTVLRGVRSDGKASPVAGSGSGTDGQQTPQVTLSRMQATLGTVRSSLTKSRNHSTCSTDFSSSYRGRGARGVGRGAGREGEVEAVPTPYARNTQSSAVKSNKSSKTARSAKSTQTAKTAASVRSGATAKSDLSRGVASTAAALLMLRDDTEIVADDVASPTASDSVSTDIRNFLRAMEQPGVEQAQQQEQQAQTVEDEQAQQTHSPKLSEKRTGVYFRKEGINFGAVVIGSLTRANLELCNATDSVATVFLGDPLLPFVLLHNEVTLRPRSYVRVPIRYLPTRSGDYRNELIAQTADGVHHAKIALAGSAYA